MSNHDYYNLGRNLALQGHSEPLENPSNASNSNNGFCNDQLSRRDGVRIETAQHQRIIAINMFLNAINNFFNLLENIRYGYQHPVNPNQPCNTSSSQESTLPYANGHRITPGKILNV